MRYRRRRRGIVPFAFAVLLSVAAGLSLADERGWEQAEAPAAGPDGVVRSDLSGTTAHRPGPVGGHDGNHDSKPAVGSRALLGHEDPAGHDDVEPAADKQPH
jgi:hypothetical protein